MVPGAIVERRISEWPGRSTRQQVVERGADVAHVDLDVRERGRPERDHDVSRLRGVGDAVGQLQPPGSLDALEQLLCAGLGERHLAGSHRGQQRRVVVDPDHPQAAVGEAQRQRQPDPAKTDHGDIALVTHGVDVNVLAAATLP